MRCLDLIGRLGPMTAGRLAEESGLTTGAVTFILDRLEEAGMVTRRRDTEDRRRVWVEIVPEARQRLEALQQPVAEEMRQVAQRFKADELAIVRDFMRQAKEVFQRQVLGGAAGIQSRLRPSRTGTPERERPLRSGRRRESRLAWPVPDREGSDHHVTALADAVRPSRARRPDAVRLRFRPHARPSADGAQGPPGRQGRQPGRDDVGTQAPGAAGVHHLDRRLPRLHGGRLAQGPRRRGGGGPDPARDGDGQGHRRRRPTRCSSRCARAPSSPCPG